MGESGIKGRVRRCTIEGAVLEIKTKKYISYLEPFLIWFGEKEQHKEGERRAGDARTARGRCVEDARTVCGGRADNSQTGHGQCGWHANGTRTTCEQCGGHADNSRTVHRG